MRPLSGVAEPKGLVRLTQGRFSYAKFDAVTSCDALALRGRQRGRRLFSYDTQGLRTELLEAGFLRNTLRGQTERRMQIMISH